MAIYELKLADLEAVESLRRRRLTTRQIAEALGMTENMVVCTYRKLEKQPRNGFMNLVRPWL